MNDEILCVGEVLWDALPEGLFLGGAPFNVACHLHALGEKGTVVSRVGDDRLGREVLRRLDGHGMGTDLVQTDPARETGFVEVTLDEQGEPDYVIVEPAAWDALAQTEELTERARQAGMIVFGSLAQRAEISRQTIRALCRTEGLKVFDVNLRVPYVQRAVVEGSLEEADVVKLNEEELARLFSLLELSGPVAEAAEQRLSESDSLAEATELLASRFDCRVICVTRGAGGGGLWKAGQWWAHPGYRVTVKDTVGAGDAFLAALLSGLLAGHAGDDILDEANRLGAYVAAHSGATPAYEVEGVQDVHQLRLDGPASR